MRSRDPPNLTSQHCAHTCATVSIFLHVCCGSNSGTHTWVTGTLPIRHLPSAFTVFWRHRYICDPVLTKVSLCSTYLLCFRIQNLPCLALKNHKLSLWLRCILYILVEGPKIMSIWQMSWIQQGLLSILFLDKWYGLVELTKSEALCAGICRFYKEDMACKET